MWPVPIFVERAVSTWYKSGEKLRGYVGEKIQILGDLEWNDKIQLN